MKQAKAQVIHQIQYLNKSIDLLGKEIESSDKNHHIYCERVAIFHERKEQKRFLMRLAELIN